MCLAIVAEVVQVGNSGSFMTWIDLGGELERSERGICGLRAGFKTRSKRSVQMPFHPS